MTKYYSILWKILFIYLRKPKLYFNSIEQQILNYLNQRLITLNFFAITQFF